MNYREEITLLSEGMGLGETIRVLCPACGGGSSKERSLTITLRESGLVWNCFRTNCPMSPGREGGVLPSNFKTPALKKNKEFDGRLSPLKESHLKRVQDLWGITDPPYWWWTVDYGGRVAMSVRSPLYRHRGWVLRSVTGGTPKALTYIDNNEEALSWYKKEKGAPTVLVEDIPSAVRAAQHVNAVSLLGTNVGLGRAEEIAQYAPRPIVIALDQDATDQAFRIAHKWGLLWDNVIVLPLEHDLKDLNDQELCTKLSKLRA